MKILKKIVVLKKNATRSLFNRKYVVWYLPGHHLPFGGLGVNVRFYTSEDPTLLPGHPVSPAFPSLYKTLPLAPGNPYFLNQPPCHTRMEGHSHRLPPALDGPHPPLAQSYSTVYAYLKKESESMYRTYGNRGGFEVLFIHTESSLKKLLSAGSGGGGGDSADVAPDLGKAKKQTKIEKQRQKRAGIVRFFGAKPNTANCPKTVKGR